jgi:acyl-CoA synthetase (NDP forming)
MVHDSDPLPVELSIDFEAITRLFTAAHEEGRGYLYEYEAYRFMKYIGAETPPRTRLLLKGAKASDEDLMSLPGHKVVMKIVSPFIVHKSEVGGVRIIEKTPEKIRSTWRRMQYEVPEAYANLIERNPDHAPEGYQGLDQQMLRQAIARDIKGVLMVQYMPPDSQAFGNEMIVGLRNTREFGMMISAGLGGTDTELYAERFRKGQAIVAASCAMTGGMSFFELFKKTISYKKLAGLTRGQKRIVTDEQLMECFAALIEVANFYSPVNPDAPFVIDELEYNPFAFTDYLMVPLDGLVRFSRPNGQAAGRPIAKIGKLLKPQSIGIVGVSTTRHNFGRIILDNILANGFNKENLRIVRPGLEEFMGIKCVSGLDGLDGKLDLFVVAVGASQVPDMVEEVVRRDAADAVILIPGGMGETSESRERAELVMQNINRAHQAKGGGPVFLGANSLGVLSHPGRFDTMFVPEDKVPKQRGRRKRNAAFVSQSGAFMITRMSQRPELDPAYLISIGNQNDLTLGDLMSYLKDDPEIQVIGIYAEGFKDLDGLAFSRAVRAAVLAGKEVVFYKAGRTPEGKTATSGHTASLAGDYMVCESCVRQAGGIVAQNFTQFEDLFLLAQRAHGKRINGNRLAVLSSAGFEAVGMADSIQSDDYRMGLARFARPTRQALKAIFKENRLGGLVTVKNPLDLTPGSDDQVHLKCVELLAKEPNVDAVVVSICPASPGLSTLPGPADDPLSFRHPRSLAQCLPALAAGLDKPVIGVSDGGRSFDGYVEAFTSRGMAVFPIADRAVAALAHYIENRLYAEMLRSRAE